MKFIPFLAVIGVAILQLISCNKNNSITQDNQNGITGDWQIHIDSAYIGVGQSNHLQIYNGIPGDYFDIRTDGKIYLRENFHLDTLSYSSISDSTIIISTFGIVLNGVPPTCRIINLSAHSMIIKSPEILTPGGIFGRTINLKR